MRGEKVLVPRVYLTERTQAQSVSGAVISADDIDLEVEGKVGNSGTILASESMRIKADEIENRLGAISSEGLIDLTATKDIVNLSGSIKGEQNKGEISQRVY
ncbi:MAG: hypothetical protein K0U38_09510 [Epsilonproteobacteria bacterium]|nr:hypothetical protein [Campylobacterota bacterium]